MGLTARIVEAAKDCYKRDLHLQALVQNALFDEFITSELIEEKIARFHDQVYRPGETAGLYADNMVVQIFDEDGWSGVLTRHSSASSLAYSLPFPSLLGPLIASEPCRIDRYTYPAALDGDPGIGPSSRLEPKGSIVLTQGEFWSPTVDAPAYRLNNQAPNSVYLRISGPPFGPYSHAFDPQTLEYRYSGFSHSDVTCRDILARVAMEAAAAGCLSGFNEAEATEVAEMFDILIRSDLTAPNSAWSLVQALHALTPERAMDHLRRLASGEGPLRHVAAQTLEYQI